MENETNSSGGAVINSSLHTEVPAIDLKTILQWIALTEFFGIIVFNILVYVLIMLRKRNSRMSFFVRNLAIADLSVGIIYLLSDTVIYYFEVGHSRTSCYLYLCVRYFPVFASTFAIVVLTLDRLYVVIRPIESSTNDKKFKIVPVTVSWVIAALCTIPYCVLPAYDKKCYYNVKGTWAKAFIIYYNMVNIGFPLIIIGTCYTVIVVTLYRRQRNNVLKSGSSLLIDNQKPMQELFLSGKRNFFAKAKIRTVKLLFVVISAYVICWIPSSIGNALLVWEVISYGTVFQLLHVLAPLNSFVNPLVFLMFNMDMLQLKSSSHHKSLSVSRSTSYRQYPVVSSF